MPELLEIEMYRRGAQRLSGETITHVETPDAWYLKRTDGCAIAAELENASIVMVDRLGKLLLLRTDGPTVGLRFGMTGRLVIDGRPVIDRLEYSSARLDPAWDRFELHFASGLTLAMNDPRRLGGVELEPDLTPLGPDAWMVTRDQLTAVFDRYRVAVKSLLLNQRRVAGLGNLLVDELLWRSAVSPEHRCDNLTEEQVSSIAGELGPMLDELYARGGSNQGELFPERHADGRCPRDGAGLRHGTVGGRSTWWCATHQR